jgi:hypothetical protein
MVAEGHRGVPGIDLYPISQIAVVPTGYVAGIPQPHLLPCPKVFSSFCQESAVVPTAPFFADFPPAPMRQAMDKAVEWEKF